MVRGPGRLEPAAQNRQVGRIAESARELAKRLLAGLERPARGRREELERIAELLDALAPLVEVGVVGSAGLLRALVRPANTLSPPGRASMVRGRTADSAARSGRRTA
jgi:hypothetical protein